MYSKENNRTFDKLIINCDKLVYKLKCLREQSKKFLDLAALLTNKKWNSLVSSLGGGIQVDLLKYSSSIITKGYNF